MSLTDLRTTASSMTQEQMTAGVVIGLQWAAQYLSEELFACLADGNVTRESMQVVEIVQSWLVEVAEGMVDGKLVIDGFRVGGGDGEAW